MKHMHVVAAGAALAVVAAVAAPRAGAQELAPARTVDFSLAVGGAAPLGDRLRAAQGWASESPSKELDVAGGAGSGFTIGVSVGMRPANSLVGYRVEAQYTRFGLEPQDRWGPGGAPETADGHVSSLSGTGNVVLALPVASRVRPYLTAGAGAYLLTSDITQEPNSTFGPRSRTSFGLNGGAGAEVALGTLRGYVEGRYHGAFAAGGNVSFFPLTIGLKF